MLKLVQCLFLNQKYSFIIYAKYYLSLLLLNLLKYSPALVHGDAKMDHSCLIIDSCDISSCKGAVLHLAGFTIMKNSVIRTAGNGICRYGTVWLEDDPCTFKEKENIKNLINMQLWYSNDINHKIEPTKILKIIQKF